MESEPHVILGVLLHGIGGLAAASFYIPYKKVRGWSWENYWLVGGVFSWLIAPWALALLIVPRTLEIFAGASASMLFWPFLFGMLWGIGGLTFGLSMRYLGIALGYAIALGLCAAFGTIIPPIVSGEISEMVGSSSGRTVFLGVFVCLVGIVFSGRAGVLKERQLDDAAKKASVKEFNFLKGVAVAIFSGLLSASMAYGFAAGKGLAELTVELGAPPLWQNLPVLIVILAGGFLTNFIWCAVLIHKSKGWSQFLAPAQDPEETQPLPLNYLFCAMAGITWYLQFFFYGMGTTQMGAYEFSSWTLHMAGIIIFSTIWGIALKEWKRTGRAVHLWIAGGLALLVLSTIIIGYGNQMAGQ